MLLLKVKRYDIILIGDNVKKILVILCLLLVGCNSISNEELDAINNDIIIYLSNNQYDNLVFNYVDYEDKKIVVGLSDNSVEKQEDFKEKIVDSKYIKFVQSEVINDDVKKEYTINISNLNDIAKVVINTMSQYDSTIEITDKKDIEKIYNIFYNRTTNKESVSKNPENDDEVYHIIFYDKESYTDMYIYADDDKYYLEQTDNGIYETSLNDFNTIKEYIKN